MDHFDARHQKMREVMEAFDNGALTAKEVRVRLSALADAELNKPAEKVDMELVSACEDLLVSLYSKDGEHFQNHMAKNLKGVRNRLESRKRQVFTSRITRVFATAVAVFVAVIMMDVISRKDWLNGTLIRGRQPYANEGKSDIIDPGATDSEPIFRTLTTYDWDEIVAFWGSEPPGPQWTPEGWSLLFYAATQSNHSYTLETFYEKSGEKPLLVYDIKAYRNPTSEAQNLNRTVSEGTWKIKSDPSATFPPPV